MIGLAEAARYPVEQQPLAFHQVACHHFFLSCGRLVHHETAGHGGRPGGAFL
jgi:hypothetical protein